MEYDRDWIYENQCKQCKSYKPRTKSQCFILRNFVLQEANLFDGWAKQHCNMVFDENGCKEFHEKK